MSDANQSWMRRALELAQLASELGEVPVGAVIVRDGEIIGEGYNQPISTHDPSAHAEIIALRDAGKNTGNYRLPDSTMYVTIEPCTMCVGALIHARVDTVIFGAREPKAGALASNLQLHEQGHFNHQLKFVEGVLENECSVLMRDFFLSRRR
ncbi:MAG: tRNA adenosine(34) deaminase TadA [Gammaproteobacteria bacterium]|jgi:tRNA(adenine34) deaminase|nr:tRNA adenosine(34) deaminase TadA [Gammaproteobacteria bacterium]MBT6043858.1 tRNA adenosine(34) deaminase TadA [Gammaproteobacteria bacterium]